MNPTIFYQLWCYYELKSQWVMEGFFRTDKEAYAKHAELWDDGETSCMPDYAIVEVKGKW